MTALSAGQYMEKGEVNAQKAGTGQTATTYTGYLALLTAAPTATDATMAAETEYGASGYTRQTYGATAPTAASPSVVDNTSAVTWGPFTGGTGASVTWAMLCDASSGTTANNYAALLLGTARTPLTGDSMQAAAAAFALTLT